MVIGDSQSMELKQLHLHNDLRIADVPEKKMVLLSEITRMVVSAFSQFMYVHVVIYRCPEILPKISSTLHFFALMAKGMGSVTKCSLAQQHPLDIGTKALVNPKKQVPKSLM